MPIPLGFASLKRSAVRIPTDAKKRPPQWGNRFSGAAGQIRTADLILTKDALYLLSYSSKLYAP